MAINLAEKYSKKVAERFYEQSVVAGNTCKDYKWDGVKSINVYSIDTVDPVDYTRSGTSRYGTPTDLGDTVQTLTVSQDKAATMIIDKGDNTQQMMIKNAGRALNRELREKFTPMMDKHCLSVWANYEGVGAGIAASITKTSIVEEITKGMIYLMNHSAIGSRTICYIGATSYGLLLNSTEYLNLEKSGEKALVKGQVGKCRDALIVPVRDDYMPTGNNSNKVHFMLVNPESVLAPMQIKDAKIHQDPPGISGNLLEIRWLYDAFVLDAKKDGVYACWDKANTE